MPTTPFGRPGSFFQPRILALSAAWCAHVEHRAGDYVATARNLAEALQAQPRPSHDEALRLLRAQSDAMTSALPALVERLRAERVEVEVVGSRQAFHRRDDPRRRVQRRGCAAS